MPTVKGAAVAVVGNILSVEQTNNFDTKQPDGVKIMVGTPDGFAVIKLDSSQAAAVRPVQMAPFAGLVRYGAWGGRGGQGEETCRYVGPVEANYIDLLNSVVNSAKKAA